MRLDFCALCGETDPAALEHHHFIPKVQGGTDDENNIFTVCGTCHGRIHDIPRPHRLGELVKAGHAKKAAEAEAEAAAWAAKRHTRRPVPDDFGHLPLPRVSVKKSDSTPVVHWIVPPTTDQTEEIEACEGCQKQHAFIDVLSSGKLLCWGCYCEAVKAPSEESVEQRKARYAA
jgi:hypothetical protein